MWRRVVLRPGAGVGMLVLVAGAGAAWYADRNLHTFDRNLTAVRAAGYQDRTAAIDGRRISYLEGPDDGPALVLIHGQSTDKYNYAPALPELARSFHVFAVDCYGHGRSSHDPATYSAVAQGTDLLTFVRTVVREPVLVSGHSSGGIVAAWLAANGDGWVKGALFEDPPFFTLGLPRARTTWNWVDLASTAHAFLAEGGTDWTLHSVEHARIWTFFGGSATTFIDQARRYHAKHPGAPIRWAWLPPVMNESVRAAPQYDPRFGDVFYRGAWEAGFDLEAALRSVAIPTSYEKSEASVDADGILRGATSDAEAARARALLKDVVFATDTDQHSWHWRKPEDFVQRLLELRQRAGM